MAGSQWVRLDVGYFTNPKVLKTLPSGILLHLASICWVAQHDTDGSVPVVALPTLLQGARADRRAVNSVLATRLWVPNGDDGFVVHDFDLLNGSKSEAHTQRRQWRERQQRHRDKLNGHDDVTP